MKKTVRKISAAIFVCAASSLFIYGCAAQMLDKLAESGLLLIIAGFIRFGGEDEEKDGGAI